MPQLNTHPTFRSNCQKIHFPNPTIPTPPKGSEVFVGNLPPDIHEDEIIPLFSQCGAIYKLRLMMDFDDCTRGFAFICYHTPEAAAAAVLLLHNHAVKPGVFICVHLSRDKRRLFVGNVPRNASAENIERRLCRVFDGVVRVMVFEEVANPGLNRGYAFVEFQSYVLAAIARKRMAMGGECVWGKRMVADWAFPEPVVHPVILMQIRTLYFGNIPVKCTERHFRRFLWTVLDRYHVERVYRRENYAFVHFKDRDLAHKTLQKLRSESLIIFSRQITVEWARPVSYSRKTRRNEIRGDFCMQN